MRERTFILPFMQCYCYIRMQWNLVNVDTDNPETSAYEHHFRGKEFSKVNLSRYLNDELSSILDRYAIIQISNLVE